MSFVDFEMSRRDISAPGDKPLPRPEREFSRGKAIDFRLCAI